MARAAGSDGRTCPACGAPLPSSTSGAARWCARCGAAVDGPLTVIDLGAPTGDALAERVVVDSRTRRPPRWPALAALVVLAALVAWMLRGRDGDDPAAAPASTDPPAMSAAPSTSEAPPTSVATTAASTTTGAPPATTTTIPNANRRAGRVLDAAQDGQSLWTVDDARLVRVDLGTGRATLTELGEDGRIIGAAPGVVVVHASRGNRVMIVRTDDSAPVVEVALDGFMPTTMSGTTGVWLASQTSSFEPLRVRLLAFDGAVRWETTLPRNVWPAAYGDGYLWGNLAGKLWVAGPDRGLRAVATGEVVSAVGERVLWMGCDDVLHCAYFLGTADRPAERRLDLGDLPSLSGPDIGRFGNLSPDGRSAVTTTATMKPRIVDLDTGAGFDIDDVQWGSAAWTADGAWLFVGRTSFTMVAVNARDGRHIEVELSFLSRPISQIAIG